MRRDRQSGRRAARLLLVLVLTLCAGLLGLTGHDRAQASCVGPVIAMGSAANAARPNTAAVSLRRDETFIVSGVGFHRGCEDTSAQVAPGCDRDAGRVVADPEAPLTDVALVLRQQQRTWVLDTESAEGRTAQYTVHWQGALPAKVQVGPARLEAGTATLEVMIST